MSSNLFPILSDDAAELVAGWSGANPYGMVRVSLCEHLALALASSADEYEAVGDGAYSAIVPLSTDELRLFELAELVDAAHVTTSDNPYPWGTWRPASFEVADDCDPSRSWAMLVDVDDRGWPAWEILTADDARARWDAFVAELPHDECCDCDDCDAA